MDETNAEDGNADRVEKKEVLIKDCQVQTVVVYPDRAEVSISAQWCFLIKQMAN